jgi:chemotaxis protein CheD
MFCKFIARIPDASFKFEGETGPFSRGTAPAKRGTPAGRRGRAGAYFQDSIAVEGVLIEPRSPCQPFSTLGEADNIGSFDCNKSSHAAPAARPTDEAVTQKTGRYLFNLFAARIDVMVNAGGERSFVTVGQICVEAAPAKFTTVLGSCVSICLWSAKARIGGLNHYLLPWSTPEDRSLQRGDVASARLIERMLAAGAPRSGLVAKVFGGSSSAPTVWRAGAENILCAWQSLAQARIAVVAADVGGRRGRRVTFDVSTGVALVQYLASP